MRLLLLAILLPTVILATFREQSAGAKGYVTCRGVRQPGVFVQLFDEDSVIPFDSDDLMGSTTADSLGHFCVKGTTSEITTIEPYVLIEHNCGYEGLGEKTTFFYYMDPEYIVEGNVTTKVQNLGEIELLTNDAPVQDFKKKHYSHRHILHSQRERIDQCIPLYVTYRDFFEAEVFGTGKDVIKVLPTDDPDLPIIEDPTPTLVEDHSDVDEIVKIHEDIKNIEKLEEENLKQIEEEKRKLEEDRIRMEEERQREEQRKIEEEKERIREEERRRREEEEKRRDDDRRKAEEERQKEEERRKLEYEKAMEDYRRREEERRQEILRRKEDTRREKEKVQPVSFEDEDDPCYRRIKRGVKLAANDPCYRRLKG